MTAVTTDSRMIANSVIQVAMSRVVAGEFTVEDIAQACHEANRIC